MNIIDTLLNEEEIDAIATLLLDKKIDVSQQDLRRLRFKQIEQLIQDEGHRDLAANLRTKISEGKVCRILDFWKSM